MNQVSNCQSCAYFEVTRFRRQHQV